MNADLFTGTPYEDKRTQVEKDIARREQERTGQGRPDFSGLPMFDKNEREFRATKQYNLFSRGE